MLKDYLSILSSNKSSEDSESVLQFLSMVLHDYCHFAVQRERDVKESILFMAKQSGNIDPDVSNK